MSIIRDQHNAVQGLFDFVASRQPLGTSYVKQLHAVLTANQESAEAIDQFGRGVTVPLRKGAYKRRPNNPRRADGSIHEYCPPEHVDAEMDRLVAMHLRHVEDDISPEVQSAWLHHRFTQIHPFQDGNGRVARALATLVLLRANRLPLIVTNDDRSVYLDALADADRGSLGTLVDLFAKIEKQSFLHALGGAQEVKQRHERVDHVIAAMRDDFEKDREVLRQEWESAKETAAKLHADMVSRFEQLQQKLEDQVAPLMLPGAFRVFVDTNRTDNTHWFRFQLIETAKNLGYFANFRSYHAWTRMVVNTIRTRAEILVSFHGLG